MDTMNPCGHARDARRIFCPTCGKIQEKGSLTVRTSTDETRGRALAEMQRGVAAGRADFERTHLASFERAVYEEYRGSI
jgi:hypothetical protein